MKDSIKYCATLIGIAFFAVCSGCAHLSKGQIMNENDPLMAIANIDGLDRPLQKTIQAALEEQGMDPLIEGSVMYMVAVKQSEIPRAMDVLKNDERLVGKKIIFFKPFKVNVTN